MAIRSFAVGLIVLITISCLLFLINNVMEDPIQTLLPHDAAQIDKDQLRHELGLEGSTLSQLVEYIKRLIQGNLGYSYKYQEPVIAILMPYAKASLTLIGLAMPIGIVFGIVLGLLSRFLSNRFGDSLNNSLLMLHAIPGFVPCILAIEIFAVYLKWLPASGSDSWQSYVMPIALLSASEAIRISVLMNSSLREAEREAFMLTARAKGLSSMRIQTHYLFRSALAFLGSVLALQFGYMLSSTVIVETVFSFPGLGNLALHALVTRDLPLIQGCVLVSTFLFLIARLVIDLLYPWIDPRIRQTWLGGRTP
jgi:ABC-type dipeptide/oligopeptide/nickel transport system permease component